MKLSDPNRLLRGFGLARLAVAALLLAIGPLLPEDLMPDANRPVLALTLLAVVLTSGALAAFSPVAKPLRIAWLVCLLDTALVTAVVAATGGPRSIFAFLYVLSVTAACVLLSRVGGLTIAAASSVLLHRARLRPDRASHRPPSSRRPRRAPRSRSSRSS